MHDQAPDLGVGRIAVRRDRQMAERVGRQDPALDPRSPAALDNDACHPDAIHDPGAVLRRAPKMDPNPGLLGPDDTTEWAGAADATVRRVATDELRLPTERPGATQDELVLRRNDPGGRDAHLAPE